MTSFKKKIVTRTTASLRILGKWPWWLYCVPQLANQGGENKTKTKPARLWYHGKNPKKKSGCF